MQADCAQNLFSVLLNLRRGWLIRYSVGLGVPLIRKGPGSVLLIRPASCDPWRRDCASLLDGATQLQVIGALAKTLSGVHCTQLQRALPAAENV